jgi:predicted CoA-binding protein
MNQAAKDFIEEKKIALVGVSRDPKKFGQAVLTDLKNRGYEVFPVHPEAEEIAGVRCYRNLAELQGKVDALWIGVKPEKGAEVMREAARLGIKKVWIQQGGESKELEELGKELGLDLVMRKCVLMYAEPVTSFHAFHRFFVKLFGQY